MASFDKRVKQIADAEKDVDKVLKAARLKRTPMSDRRLEMIMEYILYFVIIGGMFVMMTVIFYMMTR